MIGMGAPAAGAGGGVWPGWAEATAQELRIIAIATLAVRTRRQ